MFGQTDQELLQNDRGANQVTASFFRPPRVPEPSSVSFYEPVSQSQDESVVVYREVLKILLTRHSRSFCHFAAHRKIFLASFPIIKKYLSVFV